MEMKWKWKCCNVDGDTHQQLRAHRKELLLEDVSSSRAMCVEDSGQQYRTRGSTGKWCYLAAARVVWRLRWEERKEN
jgi:hypothetical protein